MDGRKSYTQSWYWEKIDRFIKCYAFFFSGINSSIFLPLTPPPPPHFYRTSIWIAWWHPFKNSNHHTLAVFLRHLSYCCWKTVNEGYEKIYNFSNFKCNLVSQFNKLQDAATKLGSKDTFFEDLKLPSKLKP